MAKWSGVDLANSLPVGQGCLVNEQTPLPTGWHASVFPDSWDLERDYYPDPDLKQVGWILLPERFHMVVHWPELEGGKTEHGGALVIGFEVLDGELQVRDIYGVDMDVEDWIEYLVQEFPPSKWKQFAALQITRLLALEAPELGDVPGAIAVAVAKSVRKGVDLRKEGSPGSQYEGSGKRHRITEQHLEEVAEVYRQANSGGRPPTRAVAEKFGVAHSTAAKWVGAARRKGMLPPTAKGSRSKTQ